mgnify:CR=1 FL=1
MQVFDKVHAFIWNSMTANNCNTYLIDGPTRILIDPGHLHLFDHVRIELGKLDLDLDDLGLVICKHIHPDHIEAAQLFKQMSVPVAFHEQGWNLIKTMEKQITAMGVSLDMIIPDFFLKEGDLSINGLDLKIFHTPGHSPGSICILWPETGALITGDLIFKEGLGRTDLPGGNGHQIKESILRMADLDIEWILPGHGDILSGKKEVRNNFAMLEQFYFSYV